MNFAQLFSDPALRTEFLDRYSELQGAAPAVGLEGLDAIPSLDRAAEMAHAMAEGSYVATGGAFEAIIERFTRPVHLVQNDSFTGPDDNFPSSAEIATRLERAKPALDAAIRSVGRIDLVNHRMEWVGTAWMVRPNIAVTNRHVAEAFARPEGDGFVLRSHVDGRRTKASVDWCREYALPRESCFAVKNVLWIEPDPSFDVALLEIAAANVDGHALPRQLDLMSAEELRANPVGAWVAVIGYPARDSRNRADDQQRIFDGIYNVKRLAPGQLTSTTADGLATHDATTLGGNSGSPVIDLASGKVVALHFGGIEAQSNYAVQAPRIAEILRRRVA